MTKVKLARLEGQSSDIKPLKYKGGNTPLGALYEEIDTGKNYKFDGQKYNELSRSDESKNFFSKQSKSSLIQLFGDEFAKVSAAGVFTLEDLTNKQGGTSLTNVGQIDMERIEEKLPLRGYKVPNFDGSGQRLVIPVDGSTNSGLDVSTDSFLVKIDFRCPLGQGTSQNILCGYGDVVTASEQGWRMRWDTLGHFQFTIDDGTNVVNATETEVGGWDDDEWHTAIMLVDRTNDILYNIIDGQLRDTSDISSVTGTLTNTGEELQIGCTASVSSDWIGQLSNFQLYIDSDPNNLFNLVQILSNTRLRESASDSAGNLVDTASSHRLNNRLLLIGGGGDNYEYAIINTSEGFYDLITNTQLNSSHGFMKIDIDGVNVFSEDLYSASSVVNTKFERKNIFLSGGTHLLKIYSDEKNQDSSNYQLVCNFIELIKRDGNYNESDEATNGILFGDEINQRESTDGDWLLTIATGDIYNNRFDNTATTADDGDWTEGDIYIKKGLYNVSMYYAKNVNFGIFDVYIGGIKVFDAIDGYNGTALLNVPVTRSVFLEGGKSTVRVQINGKNASSSDYRVIINAIRFELVDGKGNGDRVTIWGVDQDYENVSGASNTLGVNTSERFNLLNNIVAASAADGDHNLNRRYFSGGTYLVQFRYATGTAKGIIDIGLDSDSTAIFSQLDMYENPGTFNDIVYSIVNIPRGYHDVHFLINGKNASSTDYAQSWDALDFIKIGELIDPTDDNSDEIYGKIIPLGSHRARKTESTFTFNFASLDLDKKFSEIIVKIRGQASASLALLMRVNGVTSSNYQIEGRRVVGGSSTPINLTGQSSVSLASTTAISGSTMFQTEATIQFTLPSTPRFGGRWRTNASIGIVDVNGVWGLASVSATNLKSLTILTSTSTWLADTVIDIYGVLK